MDIELAVHGTSAYAEYVGPGQLENVQGVAWSDVVGLRRGWGTTFRIAAGKLNWIHISPPTPIAVFSPLESPTAKLFKLVSIFISYQSDSSAKLVSVHVWAGNSRIYAVNNLNLAGDFRDIVAPQKTVFALPQAFPIEPNTTIGVSLGVRTGSSAGEFLVQGVTASYKTI